MDKRYWFAATLTLSLLAASACSSVKSAMGLGEQDNKPKPIKNPFGDMQAAAATKPAETLILRSKRGDGAVEVEVPKDSQGGTDFVIPIGSSVNPGKGGRGLASYGEPVYEGSPGKGPYVDSNYRDRAPTVTDREIVATFPQGMPEDDVRRKEIERNLGLNEAENSAPVKERSYLAAIDHVKQLYKAGRYEAALLEVDEMVRDYPTNPKLYEMRGTLLDRLGRTEMAIKSWKQALRFNPGNSALQRFVDRREKKLGMSGGPVPSPRRELSGAPVDPTPAAVPVPAATGGPQP